MSIHDLDDDDRFLIRALVVKGKSVEEIAAQRKLSEEVVKEVLQQFYILGNQTYKDKKYRESAFWFFQHKTHILNIKTDFARFDLSLKRCRSEYPEFKDFLEGEYQKETFNVESPWDEIKTLWSEVWKHYQLENADYEAQLGQVGGALVGVDKEEQYLEAVGKINVKTDCFSGCLCTIDGKIGVLTYNNPLDSPDQCDKLTVSFEKFEGDKVFVLLQPDRFFYQDPELKATFIAVDPDKIDDLEPLEIESPDVKEDAPVYSYFHYQGNQKVCASQKIVAVKNDLITFDGDYTEGSAGAPLYCQDNFIGLIHGDKKTSSDNEAVKISAISKWLRSQWATVTEEKFAPGEEVLATWTDGYEYRARIEHKTETGYSVNYFEFGTIADQDESTIEKIKKTEESKDVSQENLGLIEDMIKVGKHPQKIAAKLHVPLPVVETVEMKFILKDNKLDHLIKKFQSNNITKTILLKWPADNFSTNLTELGVKSGSIVKLQQIRNTAWQKQHGIYDGVAPPSKKAGTPKSQTTPKKRDTVPEKKNYQVKKIENFPMPEGWEPADDDVNLSEEFKKDDGTYSVRFGCQKIAKGYIPAGIEKGKDCNVYVFSSRYSRYFKITISWRS